MDGSTPYPQRGAAGTVFAGIVHRLIPDFGTVTIMGAEGGVEKQDRLVVFLKVIFLKIIHY